MPVEIKDTYHFQCQGCGKKYKSDAEFITHIREVTERVLPGETMPYGECPDENCGALVHRLEEPIVVPRMKYTEDDLVERILKMPKENIFHLMILALDEMESYNGQSKLRAIMRGLDCAEQDGEGEEYFRFPSLKEMKEKTEGFPPFGLT